MVGRESSYGERRRQKSGYVRLAWFLYPKLALNKSITMNTKEDRMTMKINTRHCNATGAQTPANYVRRLVHAQKVCLLVLVLVSLINVLCSTLQTLGYIPLELLSNISSTIGILCLLTIGAYMTNRVRILNFYRANANTMSLADYFDMFSNVNLIQRWNNPYQGFLRPFATRLAAITESEIRSLNVSQISKVIDGMQCGNREFTLAALPILSVRGEKEAMPFIDALAAGKGVAAKCPDVRSLAIDCKLVIAKRIEDEKARLSLLRCTYANAEDGTTLLRPDGHGRHSQ